VPRFQRLYRRLRIDERPAAGVDHHHAWFGGGQRVGVDQALGLRRQRAVEGDHVRLGKQPTEVYVLGPAGFERGRWLGIVEEHAAAEALEDVRDDAANPPRADDAHRLAVEVEAEQPIQGQVALADAGVGPVYLV
jgi:hypothetical protein